MGSKTFKILLSAVIIAIVILAALRTGRVGPIRMLPRIAPIWQPPTIVVGQTVYLSDLPWERATTGWLAVANDGFIARDLSFAGKPIKLRDVAYDKGIGTYPVSEIEYKLGGQFVSFEARVGLDDEVPLGLGGVEFLVFVDDALAYRSGVLRGGDPVAQVELPLEGAEDLRLVVMDATEGAVLNYADWADARLVRQLFGAGSDDGESVASSLMTQRQLRQESRNLDVLRAQEIAAAEMRSLDASQSAASLLEPFFDPGHSFGGFDEEGGRLWLKNNYLGVSLGYGDDNAGELGVLHLPSRSSIIYRAAPQIRFASGERFKLSENTRPVRFKFDSESQPGLGTGKSVEATYVVQESAEEITARLTLYDDAPYFVFEMRVRRFAADAEPVDFHLLASDVDAVYYGEDVEYLTDYSRPRHGILRDDGVVRKDVMGLGKPLLIWSGSRPQALLLAALDESQGPMYLKTRIDPGRVMGGLGLLVGKAKAQDNVDTLSSPRLYVEVTGSSDARQAYKNFKRVMATLYPPAPMPSWVRYQWLSWYVYYMGINEEQIKRQIDFIAANLADLGPWNILVDAGWYVSEGRAGGEWRNVDADKFPSGLRALVDYAHARGIKVVLYFSAPYLDSRSRDGDWLGLRGIIDQHRDWLVFLGEDESRQSFAYDFSNPALREYVRAVLEDFFVKYDVDGIKIDGLGNAEGAILSRNRLDSFGLVESVAGQTLDIYRFIYENGRDLKSDVYIESGWQTPVFAQPYAHTFRYGDENDLFSNPYPFPGLVEHVDYAVFQKMALGQRPNMGAIMGDPSLSVVNQWWLGAGLALGTQVVLSFDLPSLAGDVLSEYRSLLAHYNAFDGETRYGSSLFPDSFATTVGDITYLGLINRGAEEKQLQVSLADFGLEEGQPYGVYDVGRKRFIRSQGRIRVQMPGETFRLFVIRSSPGLMWTNSSATGFRQAAWGLEIAFKGPASMEGFAYLYTPEPRAVFVDGRQLGPSTFAAADENTFWYNARTNILALRYNHAKPHQIMIIYP
ncbi:MAG: NPCBM/NEW2 domain-containing protein [Chloroflexi bacterium]|nr:NPCBM/NEW2 domain-containing protein [Chloroflexota bacterium]